jgi:hypothetical protein
MNKLQLYRLRLATDRLLKGTKSYDDLYFGIQELAELHEKIYQEGE